MGGGGWREKKKNKKKKKKKGMGVGRIKDHLLQLCVVFLKNEINLKAISWIPSV